MHPSLPVAESCRRLKLTYSWEAWDSFVGQPAQGILMALPNLHTAYKPQRSPLDLLQLLLHLGPVWSWFHIFPSLSSSILISFDIAFPLVTFLHIESCLRRPWQIQGLRVIPPSSPWPYASVAAGFWRARDKTVLYGTGVVGRAGMHLSNTIHPPKWTLMYAIKNITPQPINS